MPSFGPISFGISLHVVDLLRSPMDSTYQREVAIFDGAMDLPPEQRPAYLEQTCGRDPALRRRVEALLRVGDASHPILDSPAEPVAAELPNASSVPFETAGQRIGRYKLLQQIGEGGAETATAEDGDRAGSGVHERG